MLLSFRAKNDVVLESFLDLFQNPSGVVHKYTHLWLYGNMRVWRLPDDLVVIETNGMLELLGKYALFVFSAVAFVGFVLNIPLMIYSNIPFIFLSLLLCSSSLHSFQCIAQLKRVGYEGVVSYVSYWSARVRLYHAKRNPPLA